MCDRLGSNMILRLSRKHKITAVATIAALAIAGVTASLSTCDQAPTSADVKKLALAMVEERNPGITEVKELVQDILAGVEDLNEKDSDGNTPLMRAAMVNSAEDVQLLLVKGARIQDRNKEGKRAIDLTENKEIRQLLECCEIVDMKPTPLQKEKMQQEFRNYNIDPTDLDKLIFKAARNWRGNRLLSLAHAIALGANMNNLDDKGEHILQYLTYWPKFTTLFLRYGANPNALLDKQGGSRILAESINYFNNVPPLLLAKGASVKGANVIAAAAGNGNVEMVKKLIELGADPTGMTDEGRSVLECAVRGDFKGESRNPADFPAVTRLLLEAGASTEIPQADGTVRSPLSPGAMSINAGCIRELVDAGADVNTLNSRGANYAMVAAHKDITKENLELLEDIISDTDTPNLVDNHNENILFYAIRPLSNMQSLKEGTPEEKEEAKELLEDYYDILEDIEPDVTQLDRNGNTPLHLAAAKRWSSTPEIPIQMMLKLGVDPTVRNKFGRTALDVLLRQDIYDDRFCEAFKALAPVSPEPANEDDKVKIAVLTGDVEKVENLMSKPDSRNKVSQYSYLTNSPELLKLFIDAGFPIENHACAKVIENSDYELLEVLAEHNKHKGLSRYWHLVHSVDMAEAMLDAGVSPPQINNVETLEILKMLVEKDLVSLTSTPLNPFSYRLPTLPLIDVLQKPEFVKYLLEAGIPVNGYAVSPLSQAYSPEVAELLIKHGVHLSHKVHNSDLLTYHRIIMYNRAHDFMKYGHDYHRKDFLDTYAIYKLLEKQDFPKPHPRADEIKKALTKRICKEEYDNITLVFPNWSDKVRINREAMVMARTSQDRDTANITQLSDDYIEFNWDRWGTEAASRRDDGKFYKCPVRGHNAEFLKNPTKALRCTSTLITSENKEVELLFSPDLTLVYRADTAETGYTENFKRLNSSSSFDWHTEDGKRTTFIWVGNGYRALDAETVKKDLTNYRPSMAFKEERLAGKGWADTVRISQEYKVAARTSRSCDTANIIEYADNRIVLKWDRWGIEIFYKHPDGVYRSTSLALLPEQQEIRTKLLNNDKSIRIRKLTLVHPAWQGPVNFSFKHKVAAQQFGKRGTAEILEFSKNSITLKWDKWGVETFERRPDGKFHKVKK